MNTNNHQLEELLFEKDYIKSRHDKLVKKIDTRLKSTGLYDTVLHNAEYFYPNGNQVSDADNIAINHKLRKIIYIEDKSNKNNPGLIQKGVKQILTAKRYFNTYAKQYTFYGFLCLNDKKINRYKIYRVV